MENELMVVEDTGRVAGFKKLKKTDNPYRENSKAAKAWEIGRKEICDE